MDWNNAKRLRVGVDQDYIIDLVIFLTEYQII